MTDRGTGAGRPPTLSRRGFLWLASAAVGGLWIPRALAAGAEGRILRGEDPSALSPLEREHLPLVRLPPITSNGAKVPIVVELDHPMTADHHITSLQVTNPRDPVPSKGTFQLTPANGRAYLSFQFRVDAGPSNVLVTAECNRHGRWSTHRTIVVPEHGGG